MSLIFVICFAVLLLSSAAILYADFKERQIALWLLLLFGCNAIVSVVVFRGWEALLYNTIGVILYLAVLWLILKAYLFVKHRKHIVILDEQLGKADVLMILFIGLTFNPPGMILFFCFGFVCSLLIFMAFQFINSKDVKSIPLAGLLVFFYLAAIITLNQIPLNLIDCSFIKS